MRGSDAFAKGLFYIGINRLVKDVFRNSGNDAWRHIGMLENIRLIIIQTHSEDIVDGFIFLNIELFSDLLGCKDQLEMNDLGRSMSMRGA